MARTVALADSMYCRLRQIQIYCRGDSWMEASSRMRKRSGRGEAFYTEYNNNIYNIILTMRSSVRLAVYASY